jgi:hypothetical protein
MEALHTIKTGFVMKHEHVPRTWTDTLVCLKQWKRDKRFGTWNVRSLYRSGSITTVARELAGCKVGLVSIRGLLEKYPTFGREKETGLLGALDT